MGHKNRKRKLPRLERGRPGDFAPWGGPEPDSWIDETGCPWLLYEPRHACVSRQVFLDSLSGLAQQGLIERRRFTIDGQVREGVRIREAALELKLAMLEE